MFNLRNIDEKCICLVKVTNVGRSIFNNEIAGFGSTIAKWNQMKPVMNIYML